MLYWQDTKEREGPNPYFGYHYIVLNDFKIIDSVEDYKLALILAAYNGGITRLRKNGYDINKMPGETRNYVKKVMKLYKEAK